MVKPRKPSKRKTAASTRHVALSFQPGSLRETAFTRADLVFTGVDHSTLSYEVRVFLNNKKAGAQTERTRETGYAGRFTVFGHGGCFGEEGHCDTAATSAMTATPAVGHRSHPLAGHTRILTITEALRHIVEQPGGALKTLTLVPISKGPNRADHVSDPELLKFDNVTLQTYR